MKRNSFTTSWRDLMRCSFELVQYERAPVRAIAVDIAEQVNYLVTGEFREFTDASHEVQA